MISARVAIAFLFTSSLVVAGCSKSTTDPKHEHAPAKPASTEKSEGATAAPSADAHSSDDGHDHSHDGHDHSHDGHDHAKKK